MKKHFIYLGFFTFLLSCASDNFDIGDKCVEEVTYDGVRPLLISNCGLSGCHDGSFGLGDYSTFRGVERTILDGSFEEEVFQSRTMPPNGAPPLSQEDFDLLRCWSDNGFPEN